MRRFIHLAVALAPVLATSMILPARAGGDLHIVGDRNHDTYLGCITCNKQDSDSIRNRYGRYGNNVSPTSIFNNVSMYGSSVSPYSACNSIATNPPIVVDDDGIAYGYLTVNPNLEFVDIPGFGFDFESFLTGLCR